MARRRPRWRVLRFLIGGLMLAAVIGIAWEAWTWPDVAALVRRPPRTTGFIEQYRARERAAGRTPRVAWTWVDYGRVSADLKRAVLVAEDVNFFSHGGFDTGEIREALKDALEDGTLRRGASTITQQLAKNL